LEKLQDQANPQPFEDAKRVLEQELGVALEDVFLEFEPEARAAASLAQVRYPNNSKMFKSNPR